MLRRLASLALFTMASHAHAAPADWLRAGTVYALAPGETPQASIVLLGNVDAGRFTVTEHELPAPPHGPQPPLPLPLHTNLLPMLDARAFGVEERVTARLADGRLAVACRAGARTAGVVLSAPAYLPRANVALAVHYTASAAFDWQAADAARAAREGALDMGALASAAQASAARLALPAGLDRGAWRQFVVLCPASAATLDIDMLALEPAATPAPAPRATWIWRPADWIENGPQLLDWAAGHGIADLFVTVPLDDGAAVRAPALLAGFVRAAGQRGMRVYSVDGDPHMILPGELPAAVRRAQAYAAYNAAAAPQDRLAGMQFDVEPYLLPEDVLPAGERDARYLALARALKDVAVQTGSLRLEFVVPFWWAGKRELLDALAPYADALAVMDYRTDPGQIAAFAVPFLDWAQAHGKRARIALEAGPIEAQTQRRYVRAQRDEPADLLAVDVDGRTVLVLPRQPLALPAGAGLRAYRLASSRVLDGSATTFHADKPALLRLLPRLEADFGAWDGFGGIAVHELK